MTQLETHTHYNGALLAEIYVAQQNSDAVQWRGGMVDVEAFENCHDARDRVLNCGPEGIGDGDVIKRTYYWCETCPDIVKVEERIYIGDLESKKSRLGLPPFENFLPNGWRDDYTDIQNDPEYSEYMRLRDKFNTI